ncbi:MAG: DUF1570 domain-containing protein [Pirellulales bacterium]
MTTVARIAGGFLFAWAVAFGPLPVRGDEFMFRARVEGRMLEGKPLSWSSEQIVLLNRDGQLFDFNPKTATETKKTSPRFFGFTSSEMKSALQQEFGKLFDVSATRHYLVVHPVGERDQWANRFEELYKRFTHYFRVRGFAIKEPPYPLVAIVYRNQDEYYRAAKASGTPLHPGTLGHYDRNSNRVFLFDSKGETGGDWSQNADTIIHEATHQTAYNTGIHMRFADRARWVTEGLATMFEARGFWDAHADQTQADRINRGRLAGFQDYVAKRRKPGALLQLISTDNLFRSDVDGAYAEAWALSFYLCETQPRLYAAYLQKTADRATFSGYTAAERMDDFQDIFGREMKMFEIKFLRYMAEVK